MDSKVLIGITSKNRYTVLPKAIESAIGQLYENKEIAVYDDNSTDATKTLTSKYSNVKWYFSDIEKGYLFGRNMFLATTDATYYCSLDDDSWFLNENHLQQAIDYALLNQASVKNATLDETIADQKVKELIGLGTPQISGEATLNKLGLDYQRLKREVDTNAKLYDMVTSRMKEADITSALPFK